MSKNDRIKERKGRNSFPKRTFDLGCYLIVTDTQETEENYILGLKEALPDDLKNRISIKTYEAKTSKMIDFCKEKAAQDPQYREPWIIFDRDKVPDFDNIVARAVRENVCVGWSNPCLEIWFDAYFGSMPTIQESKQCWKKFAELFERKTGIEYAKSEKRIYNLLAQYGNEEAAIKRAKERMDGYERGGIQKPSEMCPGTTVYQLVNEIRTKINDAQSK